MKLLLVTLSLSWMGMMGYFFHKHPGEEYLYLIAFPFYILMLAMGLGWFYHRLRAPVMALDRRAAARRPWTRAVHFLFSADAYGALRALYVLWGACLCFLILVALGMVAPASPAYSRGGHLEDVFRILSYPFAAPYYLFFPAGLFQLAPVFRRNSRKLRALVVVWWGAAGLILTIGSSVAHNLPLTAEWIKGGISVAATLASPVSASIEGHESSAALYYVLPGVRAFLGVLGLILCRLMLFHRRFAVATPAAQPETAPHPTAPDALNSEPLAAVEKAD